MIVVSGSKRSGTSAWMQLLAAAGLPVIGDRIPASWEALAADFNPDGFYESELSAGIYYRTNPHPRSGAYLFPEQTRGHAVKVFPPGVVRSDVAFLDRVLVTLRGWRAQSVSMSRMRAGTAASVDPALALAPVYEWWSDVFGLLRDVATRRYAVHFVAYEALLADPAAVIGEVLGWIGGGDRAAATAAVRVRPEVDAPGDADAPAPPPDLAAEHVAVFDALHDHVRRGVPLTPSLVAELNRTDAALRPRLLAHNARLKDAAVDRLLAEARGGP
ncbi:MAG: hypothetical protein R3B09_16145 [Nannocystaceae bacterium]